MAYYDAHCWTYRIHLMNRMNAVLIGMGFRPLISGGGMPLDVEEAFYG
jgi:hypothetical protein